MSDNLNIGDTAYADFGRYSIARPDKGIVTKKTATGQVTVQFDSGRVERFKAGRMIGSDKWHAVHLIGEGRYNLAVVKAQRARACEDFNRACRRDVTSKAEALAKINHLTTLLAEFPEDEA